MRFLIFFALCLSTQAADYSGKVKISNEFNGSYRIFSGTVYDSDDTNYYVVTCAHGVYDLAEEKRDLIVVLRGVQDKVISANIILEDIDRDISIMIFQKLPEINVKIYPLAEANCNIGTVCDTEGFAPNLTKRKVTISSYTKIGSNNGEKMTTCIGNVEQGMSGCGLIYNDQTFGVLSGRDSAAGTCFFASLSQMKTVVGKIK